MRNAIITTFYIFAASAPLRALAEVEYRLSAPLPGGGSNQVVSGKESFIQYIEFLFPFLLSAAAILALVMFIYGAMTYMIAGGNPQKLGDAKSRMVSALMGLLLAVSSVLILKTINPQLVKLKLPLRQVGSSIVMPEALPGARFIGGCAGKSWDPDACPAGMACSLTSSGLYACDYYDPAQVDCASCSAEQFAGCISRGFYDCTSCKNWVNTNIRCI